ATLPPVPSFAISARKVAVAPLSSSDARAINNAGQVAGSDTGASGTNAVIWNGTTPTSLGPGFANSINSFGT
ncbi:MAG: hypothetical protein WAN75_23720, partial [Xanthobacteraceae bacterium]